MLKGEMSLDNKASKLPPTWVGGSFDSANSALEILRQKKDSQLKGFVTHSFIR